MCEPNADVALANDVVELGGIAEKAASEGVLAVKRPPSAMLPSLGLEGGASTSGTCTRRLLAVLKSSSSSGDGGLSAEANMLA